MKKRICSIMLLIALLIPLSAQAVTPRKPKVIPYINFSGTTATCSVSVICDSTKDAISLTAKLYNGSTCIATWTESGTGSLNFSRTKTVQRGKTYKLTADVTINGTALATASTTGTCP